MMTFCVSLLLLSARVSGLKINIAQGKLGTESSNTFSSPDCVGKDITQGSWVRKENATYTYHEGKPFSPSYYYMGEQHKWDWVPNSGCEMKKMSRMSFCDMMTKNHLDEVTFVGDSISGQMYLSLLSLIGASEVPAKHSKKSKLWHPATLTCSSGQAIHLKRIKEIVNLQSSWLEEYVQSDKKTLLVLNVGAHIHSVEEFSKNWDSFLQTFKTVADKKSGDKIIFRMTAPGHNQCANFKVPFSSEKDFSSEICMDGLFFKYDWNLFEKYNDYVGTTIKQGGLENVMRILNVVPMTKMRPDGHVSQDNGHEKNPDCLHYKLPGVPDYWNHMMLAQLL